MIRSVISKLFPGLLFKLNIYVSYFYEARRFAKYCTNNNYKKTKAKHQAILMRKSHGLEKAFSLPEMKSKFGVAQARALIDELNDYYKCYGDDSYIIDAKNILTNYFEYHATLDDPEIQLLHTQFISIGGDSTSDDNCYVLPKASGDVNGVVFNSFFKSRYSVRAYQDYKVPVETIKAVLATAEKTPSACNRQPWVVRVLQDREKIEQALSVQNGNRGFGHCVQNLIVVSGKVSYFSSKERNQVFIDAGMYSLALMLGFHAHGIGSCPLNMSYPINDELKMAKTIGFDKDEVPIMMIAFGKTADDARFARSARRPVNEYSIIN